MCDDRPALDGLFMGPCGTFRVEVRTERGFHEITRQIGSPVETLYVHTDGDYTRWGGSGLDPRWLSALQEARNV